MDLIMMIQELKTYSSFKILLNLMKVVANNNKINNFGPALLLQV